MTSIPTNLPGSAQVISELSQSRSSAPATPDTKTDLRFFAYLQPVVRISPQTQLAVWEIRDLMTGEVVQSYPALRSAAAYGTREAAASNDAASSLPDVVGPAVGPKVPGDATPARIDPAYV